MTNLILAQTETPFAHPGTAGYGTLTCLTCGGRCGHLFDGKECLACHIGWDEPTVAAYEATELDEFWGSAEQAVSVCGVD